MSETEAAKALHPGYCRKCGGERQWVGLVQADRSKTRCPECKRRNLAVEREKHGGAAARNKVWESKNREKALAHKAVEHAVRNGKLTRAPCERCGSANVHAHHDDYSLRLRVMWLCPFHHKERHRELDQFAAGTSPGHAAKAASSASHGDAATLQHGALA